MNIVASVFLLFLCAAQAFAGISPTTFKGVVNVLNTTGASSVTSVVTDESGTVYIADSDGNQIIKVTPDGNASPLAINGLTPALSSPAGLAISPVSGKLYVVDGGNKRVVRLDPATGSASVLATPGTLTLPTGIAVDTADNVFVADVAAGQILKITSSGAATVLSTTSGTNLTGLDLPKGLAVDTYGNLYIADTDNGRVIKVTPAGVGSVPTSALAPSLIEPSAVAVTNDGTLYISDTSAKRVVRLDPTGVATNLPTGAISLNAPFGVAVSPMGKVYVADNPSSGTKQVLSIDAGSVGFGHVQLGNSGTPISLPFTIGSALTSVKALTNGVENLDFTIAPNSGTECTTGSSGIDCTVNVQFAPKAPGLRRGALVLSYGGASRTVPLYGIGDAPVAALSPNTATVVSTGALATANPYQIASDGAGNLYVAGYSSKNVVKLAAVGGAASAVNIGTPGGVATQNLTGVAIDGAGNLFIGDHQNSRILVVTPEGTSSVLNMSGASLGFPTALAFDAAGNLYVGDFTNSRIVKVSFLVVTGTTATGQGKVLNTGSYGFSGSTLTGMAVDSKGTVYIAARTQNNSQIIRVTASGAASAVPTPGLTLSNPQGVAVDGMDGLYIVDTGHNRIVQVTTAGVASVVSVSGLPSPYSTLGSTMFGVTPDPFGNLLIADWAYNRVVKVDVSGARLMFANVKTGSTSTDSPKTATVTNLGNQDLAFSANPTYTANFSEDTATVSPVTSSTVLTPGTSGNVGVKFTPQSAGNLSANITITNNSLNVSGTTQQIAVSGTATYPGDTTSVTVVPTPSSLKLGQSLSLTATVADTTSGHSATIPTGTVAFTHTVGSTTVSLNNGTPVALDSTGTASLSDVALREVGTHTITATYSGVDGSFLTSSNTITVTVSKADVVLSGPETQPVQVTVGQAGSVPVTVAGVSTVGAPTGTINYDLLNSSNVSVASASLPLTVGTSNSTATVPLAGTLETGSYTLRVSYGGDGNYAPSASQTIPLSVNKVTPVLTLTTSANPALVTSAVTFTATTTPAATGSVVFYDGTTALGTVALSQGTAALTTSSLSAAVHPIKAIYSGDSSYSPVTSSEVVQLVTDYSVSGGTTGGNDGATGTVPTQVVSPGGTALFNVGLTPTVTSGALPLPAPMMLTVTDNLPLGSVVMLTAPGMTAGRTLTLPAGASASGVQLQVQLPRQSAGLQRGNPLMTLPFAFGILMLPIGGKLGRAAGKRARRSGLLLLLALLGLMTIAGLSGCGAVNSGALAEQNYTITVTATSGSLSHSTTFNLTVR